LAIEVFPRLCANPNVLAVVLLGSTIRPADSSYDLDRIYVHTGERPNLNRPPIDVDLRAFESSQLDRLIAEGNDLLVWSLKLGSLVCERDSYWTRLRDSWLSRLPFPSAAIAEKRAERAERMLADLTEIGDHYAAVEQLVTALTHRARAALLRANVFPASRPEMPDQLRRIGNVQLAQALANAIAERNALAHASVGDNKGPYGTVA
jgi:hypothetical protein